MNECQEYALDVRGVYKSFKSRGRTVEAVKDASFFVRAGEVFGLLGMNGAGKSTTVKMCTGLTTPDAGEIYVYGHDAVRERAKVQALVNIGPQETAIAGGLSVRDNLVFIAEIYGAGKADAARAADAVIDRLGLSARANDRAGKLSGGLMRRLSVGMALITEPKLVFLDEPTLGLDVVARRELWKYIRELKGETAVVLTTHYLEEAESLCDRIAIMVNGAVAAVGTPDELKSYAGEQDFEEAFLKIAGGGKHCE